MTTESLAAAEERHANNLELFLDLVFVFAVTQLAVLIGEHVTLAGTLKGVLVAFLVWWQWSQFTWVGAALDLQRHVVSRALVLCAVPVTLVMTIAVPSAFGNGALWFAWAYFGVQVLVLGMQGAFTITSPEHRQAFLRYSTLALLSPAVVVPAHTCKETRELSRGRSPRHSTSSPRSAPEATGRSTRLTSRNVMRSSSSSRWVKWSSAPALPRST
jgi:low temperature requirement protein LtrA